MIPQRCLGFTIHTGGSSDYLNLALSERLLERPAGAHLEKARAPAPAYKRLRGVASAKADLCAQPNLVLKTFCPLSGGLHPFSSNVVKTQFKSSWSQDPENKV